MVAIWRSVHFKYVRCMLIDASTFNMPQTLMYRGFEACYVNRLNDFDYLTVTFFTPSVVLMIFRPF